MGKKIAKVALPIDCFKLWDYIWPFDHEPSPGIRVKVSFGKTTRVGVVISSYNSTSLEIKLKTIDAVLDNKPLLTKQILKLLCWASEYYHKPLGEVIKYGLPVTWKQPDTVKAIDLPNWLSIVATKVPKKPSAAAQKLIEIMSGNQIVWHLSNFKQYKIQLRTVQAAYNAGWLIASVEPKINKQINLNDEQNYAFSHIIQKEKFQVHYVEGVTGSGKTYLYGQLANHYIAKNQQVLILVPEISLTNNTIQKLQFHCGARFVCLHSRMNTTDRLHSWQQVNSSWAKWAVGTRSALFLPWQNLGCIIIDEAHDLSLKQQSNWRYSARDCAIMLAKIWDIPIVLGSATPSLESLYNIENKRYEHYQLTKRYQDAKPPTVKVIDMQNCKNILHDKVCKEITNTIDNQQQVLIFINRRGYAPVLFCTNCQWVSMCNNCDAKMIQHKFPKKLICHHCFATKPIIEACPECSKSTIKPLGYGSQRIEEFLNEKFSEAKIIRVDKDNTSDSTISNTLNDIADEKYNIIIGTQMLAKGHHWPKVTLVVILDADANLYSPDFRSLERFAQQFTQVAGRSGRSYLEGQVLLQTKWPNNPIYRKLINYSYKEFVHDLMQQRKSALLPPFYSMAYLIVSGNNQDKILQFLNIAQAYLTQSAKNHEVNITGPLPTWITLVAQQYRMYLIVSTKQRKVLQKLLTYTLPLIYQQLPSSLKLTLDIDPLQVP